MTDDTLDRPLTVALTLGQIFALRDLICEAFDRAPKLSPTGSHHSAALRAADTTLDTIIPDDIHDR